MTTPRFDLVILDWDGTVADSTGIIVDAVISAAEGVGVAAPPKELILRTLGLGLNQLLIKLFSHLPHGLLEKIAEGYRSHCHANEGNSYLFDGVKEGIERLYQHKCKLAVATGKSRKELKFALQDTELERYFCSTKTVDECFSKPHPHMIEAILEETKIPAKRSVIVGDTHYDLEMGRNANIQTIAVTYGAQTKDVLLSFSPLGCFDSFIEVVDFLLP
ncbi:MAG: HAD family hydrolase [Candidatus Methylopumilus sp.]|nr:HAD family hydrolase [Candidatus Methylopumilus sp.]